MRRSRSPGRKANADDLGVQAWSAFLRAHVRVVRALEREMEAETGLALSWYDVLLELNAARDTGLRMQDLAARVVLSRTRVSRVVDAMARAGMVDKIADPGDGRATLAMITDRGRRALREAAPSYLRGIDAHFSRHLTADQLLAIRDGLDQVVAAHPTSQ